MMSKTFGGAEKDECRTTNDERRQRNRHIRWQRAERSIIAWEYSHAVVLQIEFGIERSSIEKMLHEMAGEPWRTQGTL